VHRIAGALAGPQVYERSFCRVATPMHDYFAGQDKRELMIVDSPESS
jgi:hypothetical protein